jgi:phospholipase C
MERRFTRRQAIERTLAAGAGAGLAGGALDPVVQAALAAAPKRGRLRDIEHIVILMQENRSFDHYFGCFPGARGFDDPRERSAFTQPGFPQAGFGGYLQPFHLATGGQPHCTSDITHDWGPQHRSWNGGAMNRFVTEHLAADGDAAGPVTMGYHTRQDLAFYYALADAFTLCDSYHCSVMGPTDPNRLYSMSATLDPGGKAGGPLLETLAATRPQYRGRFTWTTMPEQLSARGIDWKVYTSPNGGALDSVLPYFRRFQSRGPLRNRGLKPTYPGDFRRDVHRGALPAVSWLLPALIKSEHPGFSSAKVGESVAREVLATLTANPKLWAKTALLITWDENGGFFDHVAPPAPPPGTFGEYVTVPTLPAAAQGIRGPIGLGFRVPLLVVSPFSRGGYVCSDLFDHTSMLRLLERRFGAEVPNLSRWRRGATGDLTTAFSFGRPNRSVPRLPAVRLSAQEVAEGGCGRTTAVTVPPNQMPTQELGLARRPVR